jgi:hypothetical protein
VFLGDGEFDGTALQATLNEAGWCYACHTAQSVTVQVVKTGITPQLATADRLREAETELLHPVGRLHMRR